MISFDDLAFVRRIGQGGFSKTYLAELYIQAGSRSSSPPTTRYAEIMSADMSKRRSARTSGGKLVAVKVASAEPDSLGQWRSEMAALTKLSHPNIVRYFGFVRTPPMHCLVLEYCEGGDLCERMRKPTPPGFLFDVGIGVASALAYLHERRLMHRDVKSGNVLLLSDGITPKLTDFGVATMLPDLTVTAHAHGSASRHLTAETGTYRWMAPEVITHQPYSPWCHVACLPYSPWCHVSGDHASAILLLRRRVLVRDGHL